jgi:hypothetical protein
VTIQLDPSGNTAAMSAITQYKACGTNHSSDMYKILSQLKFVANNAQTNVGGGGTPRQAAAPAFSY